MKIAKDFRTFGKIKRKYYKRHTIKRTDLYSGKRYTSYWEKEDWLGYIVKSLDEFKTKEISRYVAWMVGPVAFVIAKKQIDSLYGDTMPITFKTDEEAYTGYFRGVILTNRDANYLLEDINTKENILIPMHWEIEKEK